MSRARLGLRLAIMVGALVGAWCLGPGTTVARAAAPEVLRAQESLEARLGPIVRAYDPQSILMVRLVPQTQSQQLPVTPFVVQDVSLDPSSGAPVWEQLEVQILSRQKPFSENVLGLLTMAAQNAGFPKPKILVQDLPPELAAPAVASAEADRDRAQLERWNEAVKAIGSIGTGLLGIGVALALLALAAGLLARGRASALGKLVESGVARISASIEQVGVGGASSRSRGDDVAPARSGRKPFADASGDATGANPIASYPEKSLLACIADCYWGEVDGYGAYLWRRIPVDKKRALLAAYPYLPDYAAYLAQVEEEDLGAIEEPYYLAPLAIHHLNSEALTGRVRQSPQLYAALSTLRLDKLALSLRERIDLRQMQLKLGSSRTQLPLPDFSATPVSPPRLLRRKSKLPIRDVREEREILGFRDLPIDLMEEVPSLGWLALLPQEQIETILKPFSARDLASAWIGPDEVLESLSRSLPTKKREMVASYLSTTSASRESFAFTEIHRMAIQKLREREPRVAAPKGESPRALQKSA